MSMKNCNDTIGNRIRDLSNFSAVPQPTAPPRAPVYCVIYRIWRPIRRIFFPTQLKFPLRR